MSAPPPSCSSWAILPAKEPSKSHSYLHLWRSWYHLVPSSSPLPAAVREQSSLPRDLVGDMLQTQFCRHPSWQWTMKRSWDSVLLPVSHGPRPVLLAQRPIPWPGRIPLRYLVGATPIHISDNRPNIWGPNHGLLNRPLSQQHLTEQCTGGYPIHWGTQQDPHLPYTSNKPANYTPTISLVT